MIDSSNSVVATIATGGGPDNMIFDPLNKDVYMTNSMSDTVSIIQGTSLVTDLTVGGTPDYLALNTANHEIYVSDWSFRQVLAVSGTSNSLVSNIGVGSEVTVAAYNPTNHEIYALNGGSDNVSIITAKNTVSTTIARRCVSKLCTLRLV